jgi:hypothetical protein
MELENSAALPARVLVSAHNACSSLSPAKTSKSQKQLFL